jgi:hypothetical protein
MLDFSQVTIRNSPDVRGWPVTAKLTKLELRPDGAHVEFDKQNDPGSWPDVPFGAGTIQYTLWIVLNINGQWFAMGGIEFWRGLDANGGGPANFAANWYYDANRWAPMTGHQPAPGESVGFLVTAGDCRNLGGAIKVQERSQVVVVPFPSGNGPQTYTFADAPPVPTPVPTPVPPAPEDVLTHLLDVADQIVAELQLTVDAVNGLNTRIDALKASGVKVHF